MMRRTPFFLTLSLALAAPVARAATDEGIPVESDLVRAACGSCHETDAKKRMTRISYVRKTPEGWQLTVKRMVRTGRVSLKPEEARQVVRYFADHQSLSPAEARTVFYEAEKRPALEKSPSKDYRETCIRCHQGSRALAQRRTAEEWSLLKGFHLGYFPVAEFQSFREMPRAPWEQEEVSAEDSEEEGSAGAARRRAAPEASPAEADPTKMRVDRVLEFLAKKYPFETPEWKDFQARRTERDLSGRWLLTTHEPGRGLVAGELRLEKSGADYLTHAELLHPDGSIEKREGRAVLYAGFDWRGSSQGQGLGELKEVMMLSDDGATLAGRFFKGAFGELGMDVTVVRLGADPRIAGVVPRGLPAAAGAASLRIVGANFPSDLAPREVSLGPGVTVKQISRVSPAALELQVEVDKAAPAGRRDVSLRGASAVGAFAVYDRVDYIKVNPGEGMARLGGVRFPKQFVQFEAVAFQRGPDGEPLTADDVDLGVVEAHWGLEEYHVRHDDDDLKYVGTIDAKGYFTPNVEGPNPERHGTNNYGDVWAVAAYTPPGGKELRGRAHLLVTVPLYAYWDQPETIP